MISKTCMHVHEDEMTIVSKRGKNKKENIDVVNLNSIWDNNEIWFESTLNQFFGKFTTSIVY